MGRRSGVRLQALWYFFFLQGHSDNMKYVTVFPSVTLNAVGFVVRVTVKMQDLINVSFGGVSLVWCITTCKPNSDTFGRMPV